MTLPGQSMPWIPAQAAAALGVPTDDRLARLERAVERIISSAPVQPSAVPDRDNPVRVPPQPPGPPRVDSTPFDAQREARDLTVEFTLTPRDWTVLDTWARESDSGFNDLLGRALATQHYLEEQVRAGWSITLVRGRRRRTVRLHGGKS